VPRDDLVITEDTVLCPGTYFIPDRGDEGVIHVAADSLSLTAYGTTIIGDGTGFGPAPRATPSPTSERTNPRVEPLGRHPIG